MARRPARLDSHKQRVAIAINRDGQHALSVAACRALMPEFATRPAPEPRLSALDRFSKRLFIHVSQHEDLMRNRVLNHRGHEPSLIEFYEVVICHLSLVTGHLSLVICHWSLVTGIRQSHGEASPAEKLLCLGYRKFAEMENRGRKHSGSLTLIKRLGEVN